MGSVCFWMDVVSPCERARWRRHGTRSFGSVVCVCGDPSDVREQCSLCGASASDREEVERRPESRGGESS
eukprot:1168712-Pyramimonas_sp.AAC.1